MKGINENCNGQNFFRDKLIGFFSSLKCFFLFITPFIFKKALVLIYFTASCRRCNEIVSVFARE